MRTDREQDVFLSRIQGIDSKYRTVGIEQAFLYRLSGSCGRALALCKPSLHMHSCVARLSLRTLQPSLFLSWTAVMQRSEDGGAE